MTTKRKTQTTNPEGAEYNYSEIHSIDPNDSDIVAVETEVQTHKKKSPSLIDRAKKKMKDLASDDEDDNEPQKKSRSAPGYIRPQQREELATMASSLIVLLIAASNVPDEIAPDTDEINGVSEHLIKILARHVDLSKRLTGDVLDIIGIIAIASGWYARVAPALSEMRKSQKKAVVATNRTIQAQAEEKQNTAVENFLDIAALSGGDEPIA